MMTLKNDFRLLLYLFVGMRLVLLIVFQPQILEVDDPQVPVLERGVTWLGDFREHYDFVRQIRSDNLPYKDYWVEFPPVWHGLTALVYKLVEQRGGDFTAWASLLYVIMLIFDAGNLWLIWRLGEKLYDAETGMALAWIYALLAAPLIMLGWNFEVVVSFSMLAGLWLYLEKQPTRSALVTAFGILTKYVPVLLLPTVIKFAPRREAIRYAIVSLSAVFVVLIPLVIWGRQMAVTSLTVQFGKPSYQTVWALIDGNYGTGSLAGGEARYQTEVDYSGNQSVIPAWLRLIPFAGLGLWVFRLPIRESNQTKVAFFTLTLTLFMLWVGGWSPQWTLILLPLILLNFPLRTGVLLALVLMVGAFLEYPMLFRSAAETHNVISGANRLPFALLILTRTAILAGLSMSLVQNLRDA